MRGVLELVLRVATLVFPIASMLAIGLGYGVKELVRPLRHPHRVFRALVANFVLVPLLAFGLCRLLRLEPSLAAGLMLVGTAAGTPFLLKLTEAARADTGLSAALLVLLVPVTVVYMPLVLPLVVAGASVDAIGVAVPLFTTLLVPLAVGFVLDATLPRLGARVRPIASSLSSVALAVLVGSTLALHAPSFRDLFGTGAILAAILLVVGAFAMGSLLASPGFDRRTVMGLGAAQRNIAAAIVVATQDFADPSTLVMVVMFSLIGLLLLFPIALTLRRHAPPRLPTPLHEGSRGASV
ncbi:MAG: bile acid:sodium symporter [Pseudomonadota bacterium]|nr:MAG: transporter [Pseudomonadota bacterium]